MDTAKMPHNSDQSDNSDDLIAELARLMAEDAKGDGDKDSSEPAPAQVGRDQTHEDTVTSREDHSFTSASIEQGPAETPSTPPEENDWFDRRPDRENEELSPEQNLMREIQRSLSAEDAEDAAAAQEQGETPPSYHPGRREEVVQSQQPVAREPVQPESGVESDELFNLFGREDSASRNEPADLSDTETDSAYDPIADLIRERDDTKPDEAYPAGTADELPSTESQPVPASEKAHRSGSFDVSPVFGRDTSGDKKSDPLDEIENLIGNAVRDTGSHRSGTSASQQTPAPTAEPRFDDAATAAEAAILAATQASGEGKEVGRATGSTYSSRATEPEFTHFSSGDAVPERPTGNLVADENRRPGTMTRWALPVAVVIVLLLLGGGAYWYFGMNGEPTSGAAPVLASNTTDAKQDVEPTDLSAAAGTDSVVMNELSGNNDVSASESLVSRDQSGDVAPAGDGDGGSVSRVITPEDGEAGLANRKVRTVTVRPDGTIISGEDVLAGSEVLPVDRPSVPELPEGTAGTGEDLQISDDFAEDPATVDVAAVTPAETPGGTGATTTSGELIIPEGAPAPAPRRENRTVAAAVAQQLLAAPATAPGGQTGSASSNGAIDLLGNPVTVPTSTQANTPTQTATPSSTSTPTASAATGTSAPAYVQLSSQRTQEAAQQTIAALNSRFGAQLGGGNLEVQQVDLQDRGIFYRVRLPANSIESANNICTAIKNAGGDCFVRTQ